ncbi:MAG: cardiolipin synthase [Pseudomonadota bacterium]
MYQHYFIAALLIVMAASSATHALLNKTDSRSALGWIAVSIVFPFFGPIFYFLFGINRVQNRAVKLNYYLRKRHFESKHHQTYVFNPLKNIQIVSHQLTELPLLGGNSVEILYSGKQAYPSMIQAINSAKDYIYLSTYIFKPDETGTAFINALAEAKDRGVKVFVLIDGVGEFYSIRKASKLLAKNNVDVARFLPPKLVPFNIYINLRNHRKLLIIDDYIGFAGGMNISHQYASNGKNNPKDTHFKLSGSITLQLKHLFEADWRFATQEETNIPTPSCQDQETSSWCRTICDGPGENLGHLSIVIFSAINAATKSITIMTPYFLPNKDLIRALEVAALRGIDVSLILPKNNNLFYVDWACRHMLWQLVGSGINIYYQPGPFEHSKLFIVDSFYTLIGSANFDPRSLRLNYEVGVEIYDKNVATELTEYTHTVIMHSRKLTLDELRSRSLAVKLRDGVAWLFSPYL